LSSWQQENIARFAQRSHQCIEVPRRPAHAFAIAFDNDCMQHAQRFSVGVGGHGSAFA
jgi:hypothetical protein